VTCSLGKTSKVAAVLRTSPNQAQAKPPTGVGIEKAVIAKESRKILGSRVPEIFLSGRNV
jgi:hypothetical protein